MHFGPSAMERPRRHRALIGVVGEGAGVVATLATELTPENVADLASLAVVCAASQRGPSTLSPEELTAAGPV